MKKNVLAVALVAGLGLAGTAAAYTYGTSQSLTPAKGTTTDLATAENVAIQQILSESTVYVMQEDIQFIIDPADRDTAGDLIIGRTNGFSFRLTLNEFNAVFHCTPTATDPATSSTVPNSPICGTSGTFPSMLVKGNQPALQDWAMEVEAGGAGNGFITIKVYPIVTSPRGIPDGVIVGIRNASIRNIAELRTAGQVLNGTFWIGEPNTGVIFPGSQKNAPILRSVDVFECNIVNANEPDKYIDVADHWQSPMVPKSRFSWDGKLGSSLGENSIESQYIDFGNLTIDVPATGTSLSFLTTDQFRTTLTGGAGDDFDAFLNDSTTADDDIYFVAADGTCSSGAVLARSNITPGSATAVFNYSWGAIGGTDGGRSMTVKVCGYVDTDTVIDDTLINHTTVWLNRGDANFPVSQGNLAKTCGFPALRYNGSTMEIFYINPGGNAAQESFIRLTNRSNAAGWVRLEGIDDTGTKAASQASILVPANGSVQVTAAELQNGSAKVVGGWGAPSGGKWRAVVTAEFPGLVASSYVRTTTGNVLSNVTDSDTRGEQHLRDYYEGAAFNRPGTRGSDFYQETTPDFHGDGQTNGPLGGPNDGTTPTGGSTDPNVPQGGVTGQPPGNPGLGLPF